LVPASAPNKDTVASDILEHSFLKVKFEMSSAKPVASEDILGQKVSISLIKYNLFSDITSV
jgi:hypothetical protein